MGGPYYYSKCSSIANCKKSKSQPSPPLLSSNTPQRPDELLPSKNLVKRPILQFEGTSCFRVRGFRPFLALPRVVSFFRCFWNRPLLKTSLKPRAECSLLNISRQQLFFHQELGRADHLIDNHGVLVFKTSCSKHCLVLIFFL